ncbi:unnamed protein product [Rotaria sp. Silwood2]|nr:unnamed protein product [Rotaria sp. Silwood2]CAF2991672.1 unnamed protein product [Rotaria sp. Silwood2]CAF3340591.1 unnamed protein product [Rotaria sp. Silwood2]CAF4068274.1 unnamed protein product [Rotaria sp. Silwood2]CAF4181815.1 unnamed protein product [Rotaria sp. Silwood2]
MVFGQNMPFIQDGRYNAQTKAIEININYGGGCAEHKFQLKIGSCLDDFYPVQCDAKLIDLTTNDFCEAFIHRKVSISLRESGLDNGYYTGASIQIQGAGGSKATIYLP